MTATQDTWPGGATATMNVTYTQANAAGGSVLCEIIPGAGNEFIFLGLRALNSGTNGINVVIEPASGTASASIINLATIASGVGTGINMSVGSVSTAATNTTLKDAGMGYPIIVSGTQALRIGQSVAGAQNDTFLVYVNIRVKGAVPTVIHSNSTNPANVSVTAGAESFSTV